jgi:thiol-disulfide isomerase/thioredoxin
MRSSNSKSRNARGRFAATKPIDVTSPAQIPMFEKMLGSGSVTFVLVYADWCGHCQHYKPMWKSLTETPGRIANMAAVRDDMFSKIPKISNAKIQGYPSVIKVSPNGAIDQYTVNGEQTNAIDSSKMRDMEAMKKMITAMPKTILASNIPSPTGPPKPLNVTPTLERGSSAETAEVDIYTPVTSLAKKPEFQKGPYSPGALLTTEDYDTPRQIGGSLSVAASFASAIQAVGPAALLLAAHALMPRRSRTYKSPKKSSYRGGTRRAPRRTRRTRSA